MWKKKDLNNRNKLEVSYHFRCTYFHSNITGFSIINSPQLVKSSCLQSYGQNKLSGALQLSWNSEATSGLDDPEQLCYITYLRGSSLISEYMDLNIHHTWCKLLLYRKCGVTLRTVWATLVWCRSGICSSNTFTLCTYFNLECPDPFIVTVIVICWNPSNENEE